MFISTVILSYNSGKSLDRCLGDLLNALAPFERNCEVFVVDNGSTDASRDILAGYVDKHPDIVKPILFDTNTGTTYSRNAALRQARGDYILILDSDAYIGNEAIASLVAYLDRQPETGLAVPRLFYASGKFQLSCDVFPTLAHKLKRFLMLRKMEQISSTLQDTAEPIDVDYAISACWLMRRDAFGKTGLFDEQIFYSPEDVDYCLRIWESGYRITYVPAAEVIHDAQELSRGFRLSKFHFSHLGGLFYLFRKHRYFWGLKRLYRRLHRFRSTAG